MNTKRKGNLAEAKSISRFVELGWVVLLPFGDNEPYDLVIDRGSGFEKIQVKTGRLESNGHGAFMFNAYSTYRGCPGGKTFYDGKIDLFSVYFPGNDKIYLVPIKDVVGLGRPSLRLVESEGGQRSKIRIAKDYEV